VRRDLVEGHHLLVTALAALALATATVAVGVEGLLLLPDFGWSVPGSCFFLPGPRSRS